MRRLFAIATVLVFAFAVSSVYACGNNSGAKASKASANTSCTAKSVKAEKASMNSESNTAAVKTADVRSEKAEAVKADYRVTSKSGCCAAAAKAKAMKADASAKNCPATKDCPVPCNRESKAQNMKAETTAKAPELTASAQPVVAPASSTE